MYKIGEKVVCHTTCKMRSKEVQSTYGKIAVTRGKIYTVLELDSKLFRITDDLYQEHWFSFSESSGKTYFHSLKESRNKKLKKICSM